MRGHGRRTFALVAALVAWRGDALPLASSSASASVCSSLPYRTLSTRCDVVCGEAENACILYPRDHNSPCDLAGGSALSTCYVPINGDECDSQCFTAARDPTVFRFYFAFSNSIARPENEEELLNSSSLHELANVPFESIQFIQSIETLELDQSVTKVALAGGLEPTAVERGTVVGIQFSDGKLTTSTAITSVSLVNMDLRKWITPLLESLPVHLQGLDFTNSLMASVPLALGRFQHLERLYLNKNYVSRWPSILTFNRLRELHLNLNGFTSFDAAFPALEYLDLRNNKLAAFPSGVFSMPALRVVKLNGNPFTTLVQFTVEEYESISQLRELHIDTAALDSSSCRASELRPLPAPTRAKVCVVGTGSSSTPGTGSSSTFDSGSSSTPGTGSSSTFDSGSSSTLDSGSSSTFDSGSSSTPGTGSSSTPDSGSSSTPDSGSGSDGSTTTQEPGPAVTPTRPPGLSSGSTDRPGGTPVDGNSAPEPAPTTNGSLTSQDLQGAHQSPSILLVVLTSIVVLVCICVLVFALVVRARRKQAVDRQEPPAAAP